MSQELVAITKSTRGKNSREITFNGVGRYETRIVKSTDENGNETERESTELVTDGVVTSLDDALALVGGDVQKMLDQWVYGFNRAQYQAEVSKDELDAFVEGLDEKAADARKRAIRAFANAFGIPVLDAAEAVMAAAGK